jgi:hypothetical protein
MKFAPQILAEVRLLPTEAGGLKQPIPPGFFDCPVGAGGEYFAMRMDLSCVGSLSPGSTARVPIQFLRPEYVLPWMEVGAEFAIGKIGRGKVLEFYDNLAA